MGQINEAGYGKHYGFWRKVEPDQLERFSAVGYYFADLQNKYQVPMEIIGCNWGGTPACAWMSTDLVSNPLNDMVMTYSMEELGAKQFSYKTVMYRGIAKKMQ